MAHFIESANSTASGDFFEANVQSLAQNNMNDEGLFGVQWTGPFLPPDEDECVLQLSAFSLWHLAPL